MLFWFRFKRWKVKGFDRRNDLYGALPSQSPSIHVCSNWKEKPSWNKKWHKSIRNLARLHFSPTRSTCFNTLFLLGVKTELLLWQSLMKPNKGITGNPRGGWCYADLEQLLADTWWGYTAFLEPIKPQNRTFNSRVDSQNSAATGLVNSLQLFDACLTLNSAVRTSPEQWAVWRTLHTNRQADSVILFLKRSHCGRGNVKLLSA